jgi:hypothetical protein
MIAMPTINPTICFFELPSLIGAQRRFLKNLTC